MKSIQQKRFAAWHEGGKLMVTDLQPMK